MSLFARAVEPAVRRLLPKRHTPPGQEVATLRPAPKTALGTILAGLLLMTGCSASPDDPGSEELTAVLVSKQDHPMIDFGSNVSDTYSHVLILTEADMLEAFKDTWPGRELPQQFEYAYTGVDLPFNQAQQIEDGGDPVDGPAVADVTDGRVRLPWSGEPRYLCFGTLNDQDKVDTDGCVLVDKEPPAAVTVEITIGGLSLDN